MIEADGIKPQSSPNVPQFPKGNVKYLPFLRSKGAQR